MGVLITGDLHFSSNPRDDYRHKFVKRLRKVVADRDCEALVILGDLTEAKDRHNAELTNQVVSHVSRLSTLCPVILLKGNHDWYTDASTPFFKFLGKLPDVYWINDPCESPYKFDDYDDVLFLPHTHDHVRDWEEFDMRRYDVIFCHNTFEGALGDNGSELTGVPTSVFPKDALVVSGDIHSPQRIGPVTYAGAPYTVDFGDSYTPRLLELHAGGKLESIPCGGPQKRLVDIESLGDLKKVKGVGEGDILKVRLSITRSEHPKWHEMSTAVREWGDDLGCSIYMVQPVLLDDDRKAITHRKMDKKDDGRVMREYCRRRQVADKTAEVGLKIVGEA